MPRPRASERGGHGAQAPGVRAGPPGARRRVDERGADHGAVGGAGGEGGRRGVGVGGEHRGADRLAGAQDLSAQGMGDGGVDPLDRDVGGQVVGGHRGHGTDRWLRLRPCPGLGAPAPTSMDGSGALRRIKTSTRRRVAELPRRSRSAPVDGSAAPGGESVHTAPGGGAASAPPARTRVDGSAAPAAASTRPRVAEGGVAVQVGGEARTGGGCGAGNFKAA